MFAKGSQLAQVRPSASAATAYVSTLRTEITRIVIANTTGSPAAFDLYHDDDGVAYSAGNSLYFGYSVAANTTYTIESPAVGSGIQMARGAAIGVKPSVDLALTFTLYGVTEELANRR